MECPNAGHATPLSLNKCMCGVFLHLFPTPISPTYLPHPSRKGRHELRCPRVRSVFLYQAHRDLRPEAICRISFVPSKSSPRLKPDSISVPTNSRFSPAVQVFPQLSYSPSLSRLCPGYHLVRWRLIEVLVQDPICIYMLASFPIPTYSILPISGPTPNPSCP